MKKMTEETKHLSYTDWEAQYLWYYGLEAEEEVKLKKLKICTAGQINL